MIAVGGTNTTTPKWVVNFSRGRFSNYFYRPPYQSDTVQTFLDALRRRMYTSSSRWVLPGESLLDSTDILDPQCFRLGVPRSCHSRAEFPSCGWG